MKRTLKPEAERVVTPGPKAVEDLLHLPGHVEAEGYDWLHGVEVRLPPDVVKEEYDPLLLRRSRLNKGPSKGRPTHLEILHMKASQRGEFILSAPLFIAVLDHYAQKNASSPQYHEILDSMRPGILVNTRITWDTGVVLHYPFAQPKSESNHVQPFHYSIEDSFRNRPTGVQQDTISPIVQQVLGVYDRPLTDLFRTDQVVIQFPREDSPPTTVWITSNKDRATIDLGAPLDCGGLAYTAKR